MHTVDIIVPVYRGVPEVKRCLESVLNAHQTTPYQLIIINDASPEPEMGAYLEEFASTRQHVTLLENETNLGFVATVNRGMRLHPERDVVLLNSDTEVVNDWLDRLSACAQGERVATVTPFSNNATICSFPGYCQSNDLPTAYRLDQIDQAFYRANAGESVELPTGVGFCFYITRVSLDAVGYFDEESFGRGYGEENDFCQRAGLKGWRNLLCCDVFVFHEGGVSFSDEQFERIANAQKILDGKYPDYHLDVQKHIARDPERHYRLKAQLALLNSDDRPRALYLTHHLGGGTLKHIRELVDLLGEELCILLLRPCGEGRVELTPVDNKIAWESLVFKLPEDYSDLVEILKYLSVSRLHYHHTVGLETSVWGLSESLGIPYDITLHDYHFIGGNPSMTNDKGRYEADPEVENSRYKRPVSLSVWQDNQRQFLAEASRVLAPSSATVDIFRTHYPELEVTPVFHPDWNSDFPYSGVVNPQLGAQEALKVLVIGAISLEKGAELLEAVADEANRRGHSFDFHLLGYACRPLNKTVTVHGAFEESDVDRLIDDINPHLIWFPALWPETYSYTLSESLRSARPILAPNIGAFPERLLNRPNTWVMAWNSAVDQWLTMLDSIRDTLVTRSGQQTLPWDDQPKSASDEGFYLDAYLIPIKETSRSLPEVRDDWRRLGPVLDRCAIQKDELPDRGRREKLLLKLVAIRNSRIGRLAARLLPLALQRSIKRRLSSSPLHEVN